MSYTEWNTVTVHLWGGCVVTVGERLRELRQKRSLSQRALAAKSGVGRTYIVQAESGAIANPGGTKLAALASALNVPIEAFYGFPSPPVTAHDSATLFESAQVVLHPAAPTADEIAEAVIARLRAEDPPDPEHDPRLRHPQAVLRLDQRIPASETWPMADEYPAQQVRETIWELEVVGECMQPVINHRDIVWIDPTRPAKLGDIVAVYLDGDWTLKRLRRNNGTWLLVPDNPKFETIEARRDAVRVLGVVIKIIKDPS